MDMYNLKPKKAFTLLELIFVIVILGIVSSIGSTVIAQLYENYIIQRALHKVSLKTELAANQIVSRLTYRIDNSVIVRRGAAIAPLINFVYGDSNTSTNQILEWIAYDNDSFSAQARPGWSGYCDTTATRTANPNTAIVTPGSSLSFTNTVIRNLSKNTSGTATKSINDTAVLFSVGSNHNGIADSQNPSCYGYNGDNSCIHTIASRANNTQLTTTNAMNAPINISRHYKLAWSAYALVPVAPADGSAMSENNFDLALRYNYQPWDGSQYNNASSATLLRNVTSFKFSSIGGTFRFKLCATAKIGDSSTTNVSVCKEKVVIR